MTNRVVPIISKFHEFLMISFLMKTPLPSSKVDTIFGFFCFPFLCRFFLLHCFFSRFWKRVDSICLFDSHFFFLPVGRTAGVGFLFHFVCLFFGDFVVDVGRRRRRRSAAAPAQRGDGRDVAASSGAAAGRPARRHRRLLLPHRRRDLLAVQVLLVPQRPAPRHRNGGCGCVAVYARRGHAHFFFFSPPFLFPDFPSCCERFDVQRRLLLLLLSAVWTLCWVRWFVFFLALATQLSDDMTEFYTINSEYALARHDLYLGQVLAVEYVDRVWYRGRIAGFPGDQKVTPFFCFVFFFISLFLFFWLCSFFFVPTLRIRFSASP